MSKILFFSIHRSQEFKFADLNLFKELQKILKIDFAASSFLMEKEHRYECYQKKYQYNKSLKEAKTIWIDNFNQARNLIIKYDILIISSLDGAKVFSDYAKFIGLKVIIIDQSFGYDYDTNLNADLAIVKGNYGYKIFKNNNKKFKGKIKIISSVDACAIDYPIFNKKNKKNALFILTGAQHHDKWYFNKVNEICSILKLNKFNIFFKKHPRSYIKKNNYFKKINFVTTNALNKILHKTQIIISIHSNFYQQVNYFNYPVIFIDRLNFLLPNELRNKYKLDQSQNSINKYNFKKDEKIINKILKLENQKNFDLTRLIDYKKKIKLNFNYFGIDISSKNLNEFLKKKKHLNYIISKQKLENYKQDIMKETGFKGSQKIVQEIKKVTKQWNKKKFISDEDKINKYHQFYFYYYSRNVKNIFSKIKKEKDINYQINTDRKKANTLFVSLNTKPGYEYTDANFATILNKKIDFTFCAFLQNYYGIEGFYSYTGKFIKDKIFKKLNTIWMNYKEELKLQIIQHDIIIFSPMHGSEEFVNFAKKIGKKVIIIDSGFNYDFYPNNKADLLIFKGENAKKIHLRHKQKYLKKSMITTEPALQSEFLKKKFLMSKKEFFQKYKIKKNKFVIFLPTGPQYHNENYTKKYINICKFLLKKNLHVILKLHPTEYNKNKPTKYRKKENSFNLFKKEKNITVCDQKDFYSAIKYASNIISIHTTAYVEVNLMQKPIIFVDRLTFFGINDKKFYLKRDKIGMYNLINNKIVNNKIVGNMNKERGFKFFGQDIEFKSLGKALKANSNNISKNLKKKIIKNNQLYSKNYNENFYDNLSTKIANFVKNINLTTANNGTIHLHYLKTVHQLKKLI